MNNSNTEAEYVWVVGDTLLDDSGIHDQKSGKLTSKGFEMLSEKKRTSTIQLIENVLGAPVQRVLKTEYEAYKHGVERA